MSSKEMVDLCRVVKAIADFPYVTYILAYDATILEAALKRELRVNGHDFLQKIVGVQFELPPVSERSLVNMFWKLLENILNEQEQVAGAEHCQGLLDRGMGELLQYPRVVKKIINHFNISYSAVEDDVFWPDMLALSVIYTVAPDAYRTIAYNRSRFIKPVGGHAGSESLRNERITFHNNWLSSIDETNRRNVEHVVGALFPNAGIRHIGNDRYDPSWSNERRVAAPECFDAYFQLAVPAGSLSETEWKSFLDIINDEDAVKAKLIELSKRQGRHSDISGLTEILERASAFLGSTSFDEQLKIALKSLLSHEEYIIQKRDFQRIGSWRFPVDNAHRLMVLFYNALRNVAEKRDTANTSAFIADILSWRVGIRCVSSFVDHMKREGDKGRILNDCICSEDFPPIPKQAIDVATKHVLNWFKTIANDGTLQQRHDFQDFICHWINLDQSGAAKKWMISLAKSDDMFFINTVEKHGGILTDHRDQIEYNPKKAFYFFGSTNSKRIAKKILKRPPANISPEQTELLRQITLVEDDPPNTSSVTDNDDDNKNP